MLESAALLRRFAHSSAKFVPSPSGQSAVHFGGGSQGGSGAASTAVRHHVHNHVAPGGATTGGGGRRNVHHQRQHIRPTADAFAPPPADGFFRRLPDRGRHVRPGYSHSQRRPDSYQNNTVSQSLFDSAYWQPSSSGNESAIVATDAYAAAVDAFAVQDYGMPHHVDDFLPPAEINLSDGSYTTTLSLFGSFTKAANVKLAAVALCALLGALCILLNAFVIGSLLANRRRVLTNVFYVLVLHCSLVDLIRGGCLVAYGLPHFLLLNTTTMEPRLFALKINQFTLMILRSCNLLTIFNLLVFTTNEFIVIRYPLHYRRYFLRKTVLVILALSWLISILFGVGSALSNLLRRPNLSLVVPRWSAAVYDEKGGNLAMMRQDTGDLPLSVMCMMASFILCYVCLIIVLICYGTILNTIRNFHNAEKRNTTGSGKGGDARFGGGTSGGVACSTSLYQKRYHHDALKQTPTAVKSAKRQISHHQNHYASHQPLTTRNSGVAPACGVKVDVTPCSASNNAASTPKSSCAHFAPHSTSENEATVLNPAAGTNNNNATRLGRCNSHRKWKSHLMSRHKYLIVIGTVLFVDILFLIPYSAIQMVAIIHLHRMMAASTQSTLIRWGLQILIGVHSVCQPLCYFRMNEFRRLACCGGGGRVGSRRSGGGSNSSAAGTTVATSAVASRRRRGFFSRSKSMSNSRDPRSETETYALQSTTSVGNLTRGKTKTAAALVESTQPAADSPTARRRVYKQHKNSKGGSFSSSFGSKMSALRRLSTSSLVLQSSSCLVTVNVEDVDGDTYPLSSQPPIVNGVYDYGAHLSRVAVDEEDDGGYRFHSIETIPSAGNEENSLSEERTGGNINNNCSNAANGVDQFEPYSSPCANGAAHVIEVDAQVRPRRDRRRHSTTLAAAALGSFAYGLRYAFSFRRPVRRQRPDETEDRVDTKLERASEANRLLREYYVVAAANGDVLEAQETSRFRRRADLLNTDYNRNGRLSTLSDLRSSFSSAAGELDDEPTALRDDA